jgi:Ni/Fe-hydrogenase subunit HybB-like protein
MKLFTWKSLSIFFIISGIIASILRFTQGLGATTNLSDAFPWGLWIGFDFICVGLAAAGFTIAAIVHIFKIHRFEPIVRPSITVAFIGYAIVILLLLVDLGLPQNCWHPLIMWNPHSVMFEITWCIILYSMVLILELSPMVFEKYNINNTLTQMIKFSSIGIVIFGVILSTLHQSSFGSLYLIVPEKMHPLWYSNIIPILFFISCLSAGLATNIISQILSARKYNKNLNIQLLEELASYIVAILAIFFTIRIQDLMERNSFQYIFKLDYYSIMFNIEIMLGIILPFILLLQKNIRKNITGLFYSSLLVLFGFMTNRLNTAITSFEMNGKSYIPSIEEFAITFGLVAAGFVVFDYLSKKFNIFGIEHGNITSTGQKISSKMESVS